MPFSHRTISIASAFVFAATQVWSSRAAEPIDPTAGINGLFGFTAHSCLQIDDSGALHLYTEGTPSPGVVQWLQRSHNGTVPGVRMPQELEDALSQIKPCLPGKHHAGSAAIQKVG
jgi:hypothetical protein